MKTKALGLALAAVLTTLMSVFSAGAASATPAVSQQQLTPQVAYGILANGCTGVPDSGPGGQNFRPACDRHDDCYGRNSKTDRLTCDLRLRTGLQDACRAFPVFLAECLAQSEVYYAGVRELGRGHYEGSGNPF